jgi:hypothetical protein
MLASSKQYLVERVMSWIVNGYKSYTAMDYYLVHFVQMTKSAYFGAISDNEIA